MMHPLKCDSSQRSMILDTSWVHATIDTVLDIVLVSPGREHLSFPDERVFIDIFAGEDPTGASDGTHIPRLKIVQLGPIVQSQHLGMSLWRAQEPCEACVLCHSIGIFCS